MSKAFVLDTLDMSAFFFDKSELWGVSSSMTGFDFCHVVNVCLRLNLIRRVDFDLAYYMQNKKQAAGTLSLFDDPINEEKVYFPVYHQHLDLSESEIYVYSNKHNGNVLIPSQRHLDYFILVKNVNYLAHLMAIDKYINNLQKVGLCTKINLKTEKWIENLIL